MARQVINIGSTVNSASADTIPDTLTKINAMVAELYGGSPALPELDPDADYEGDRTLIRPMFSLLNDITADLYANIGGTGRQVINIGAVYNDPAAESFRSAFGKVNAMSLEWYGTAPSGIYGPQVIAQPGGSVQIDPGDDIQAAVDGNPDGTVFWLTAGTFTITDSVTPKTGNSFVGEFGAILDGTGWVTSDETAAAFHASGGLGITDVTIQNLEIQNMPKKGVYSAQTCIRWTIDYCEVHDCAQVGIVLGAGLTVTHNFLHHNGVGNPTGGNYGFFRTVDYAGTNLVEDNEISFGGGEQKAINSGAITWRNNYVHDNEGAGIWNDGEGAFSIIEGNTIEDNAQQGIMWELSINGTIRNNTIRRSGNQAIFVSTSRDTVVHTNTLEDNYRAVILYMSCGALTQGYAWSPDLKNVSTYDNAITVPVTGGALANALSSTGCSDAALWPYLHGGKGITFQNNTYVVPSLTGVYWGWGADSKTFAQWQAIPQDSTGSQSL